eukprot:gene41874-51114_t
MEGVSRPSTQDSTTGKERDCKTTVSHQKTNKTLQDQRRLSMLEAEFVRCYEADPDNFPIGINHPENGLLLCPKCHSYFDKKPARLLHIMPDGTIESAGLAKEQNYGNLHGKKVPWWLYIDNKKDWPTSALLEAVYKLAPKSRKRKGGTDFEHGIVDTLDLPPSVTPPPKNTRNSKTATGKKAKNASAKKEPKPSSRAKA